MKNFWNSSIKKKLISHDISNKLPPSSTSYLNLPNTTFHDNVILNTSLNPNLPEFSFNSNINYPHVLDDNPDPLYLPSTPSSLTLQAGFDHHGDNDANRDYLHKLERMMIPNYSFDDTNFSLNIPVVPSVPLAQLNYFSTSYHDHDYNANQNQKQKKSHDHDHPSAFGYQPQILDNLDLLDHGHSKHEATNFMARKMKNVPSSSSTYCHVANALMVPKLCHEEIINMPPLSSTIHSGSSTTLAASQMEYSNIDTTTVILSSAASSSSSLKLSPASFVVNLGGLPPNSWPGTPNKT